MRFDQLANIEVIEQAQHRRPGRPRQGDRQSLSYQIQAEIISKETAITIEMQRAGRFILATNVLNTNKLSDEDVLREYKSQQSTERGFRFLTRPIVFYFECVSQLKPKSCGFSNGYGFSGGDKPPKSHA